MTPKEILAVAPLLLLIDVPGASVEIERDRPGILPRLRGKDPDEDVYVEDEGDDDVPPGASVEILTKAFDEVIFTGRSLRRAPFLLYSAATGN